MKWFITLLLLFSLNGYAQHFSKEYPPSLEKRNKVVTVLENRVADNLYYETCFEQAIFWYEKGDTSLLPLLLDLADGALSAALGMILGEEIQNSPKDLLLRLSEYPLKTQKMAAILGISADGSGWPPEIMTNIRTILTKMSSSNDTRINEMAKLWLVELDDFEKQQ